MHYLVTHFEMCHCFIVIWVISFVFVVANILIMKCDWNCTDGGAIFINDI